MDLLKSIDIASGGMTAQRTRLNVISMNLANANTTKTEDGTPYRRKTAVFQTIPAGGAFEDQLKNYLNDQIYGVEAKEIIPVEGDFKKVYDPTHPDSDEKGFVFMPNVNLVEEMVHMLNANRSYEANAAVIKTVKDMALSALNITR